MLQLDHHGCTQRQQEQVTHAEILGIGVRNKDWKNWVDVALHLREAAPKLLCVTML